MYSSNTLSSHWWRYLAPPGWYSVLLFPRIYIWYQLSIVVPIWSNFTQGTGVGIRLPTWHLWKGQGQDVDLSLSLAQQELSKHRRKLHESWWRYTKEHALVSSNWLNSGVGYDIQRCFWKLSRIDQPVIFDKVWKKLKQYVQEMLQTQPLFTLEMANKIRDFMKSNLKLKVPTLSQPWVYHVHVQ